MIGDIIIFSTADWDTKPWTNKQHVAMALAKRGFRVLYVDSSGIRRPGANKSDFKRIFRRLLLGFQGARVVAHNIFRCSPLVIPQQRSLIIKILNHRLLYFTLRRHITKLGFKDILAWVYNPTIASVLPNIHPKMTIYHCVDNLGAIPGISGAMIEEQEKKLSRLSEFVFSSNPIIHKRWLDIKPHGAFYLPNVADYDHFKRARSMHGNMTEIGKIPKPRIGFVGTLSDYKIDFQLVMDVSRRRPDWHWVFIGNEREGQFAPIIKNLKECNNVHFLGYGEYKKLPAFMAGMDVASLPMLDNEYTQSMFPMKFFEYLSAGLPVVSTRLPALRDYSRACCLVGNADEFIGAVESILRGERPDPVYCDQLASQHTYDQRLDFMLMHIDQNLKVGEKSNHKTGE